MSMSGLVRRLYPALLLAPALALAEGSMELAYNGRDIYSLDLEQLAELPVSIATGHQQPLSKAPATATVITSHDIQTMGATSLEQVLESVPGLHVSASSLTYPLYIFRGIVSRTNPETLVLLNGNPLTSALSGTRGLAWGSMPLENVERIEVMRGPGSALYGADAFAGVINIITKTADDIGGSEFGLRGGSYKDRAGWAQYGGSLGPLKAAFYLGLGRSNGQKSMVEADAQTAWDSIFGTHASLAPGAINRGAQTLDASTDLAWRQWRLRASYQGRDLQTGAGLAEALDPVSRVREARTHVDISYEEPNWRPDWALSGAAGLYTIEEKSAYPSGYYLYPPGTWFKVPDCPDGTSNCHYFPDGMIGDPTHFERNTYVNLSAFYNGLAQQQLRFGAGFEDDNLYKTGELKNFLLLPGQVPINIGSLLDVSGTPAVYTPPRRRDVSYLLAQDEWAIARDWTLTAGLRHDHYSDVGDTTNPRLALVWNAAANLNLKAMHGSAFRAPSFADLYTSNNPVNIGNPALKPETIVTDELAAAWQASTTVQTTLTVFRYRWRDIIELVPLAGTAIAENSGRQTGHGLELEGSWDVTGTLRLRGNYSFQHSVDENRQADAGIAPHHRLFIESDWRFAPLWHFASVANHVADRDRQPGDSRPRVPDYTTVDLTLTREKVLSGWDLRLAVLNLFNRDAREPSFFTTPESLPYDLPLPDRSFYVQLRYAL